MDQDKNYLEENPQKSKQGVIVFSLIIAAAIICILCWVKTTASNDYSSTKDNFYVTNIEQHKDLFSNYYTAEISNGYCNGTIWLSSEEANQINSGDLVKVLVITNRSSGLSVATVNLNYEEDVYDDLYSRLKKFIFTYEASTDTEKENSNIEAI